MRFKAEIRGRGKMIILIIVLIISFKVKSGFCFFFHTLKKLSSSSILSKTNKFDNEVLYLESVSAVEKWYWCIPKLKKKVIC